MRYQIEFKPRAKDLKKVDAKERELLLLRMEGLEADLAGDVKRLTNFTPEYRLRVGELSHIVFGGGDRAIIYRVKHRKDAYS